MRAGDIRHRVVIQKQDDAGSNWNGAKTWSTYETVWASVKPVSGTEAVDGDTKKAQSNITHIIGIRYIRGIKPSMRVLWGRRIFKFKAPLNTDERNREIKIDATEETDA